MMYKIKDWFIHLLILSLTYLCIFTATVIAVYKHDKQKTIVYYLDHFKMEESKT